MVCVKITFVESIRIINNKKYILGWWNKSYMSTFYTQKRKRGVLQLSYVLVKDT